MKVISIVLNNFLNDSRVLKEALSLQDNGCDVKVIALHEDNLSQHDNNQGVEVHRIKLKSRKWSKHKLVQVIKYFEFVFRVIKLYRKSDVFHCHDLNALPIGYLIKKLFNKKSKLVYDAHEHETEANGVYGLEKKIKKFLEKKLIKSVDKVITVSDSIANDYAKMYNIEKPNLILNTPYYQSLENKDHFRNTFNIPNQAVVFLYQGGLAKGRGIELLLETFENVQDKNKVLVVMGYGILEGYIKEYANKNKNIFFHPAVAPDVLINYTCGADFGISMIEDVCLSYRYCLPNKMFEYIMAEIPVLVSNLIEMKAFVENNNVGVVIKENTTTALLEAIKEVEGKDISQLKNNAKNTKKKYNWEKQEEVLVELYKQLS